MTPRDRRMREQAERRRLILSSARELAETEGWEAVTTRRIADRIEYSQPVLYQHFKNKDALVQALALDGFEELTERVRTAARGAAGPEDRLRRVARAYGDFAAANPMLYQAMFTLSVGLEFAREDTPRQLVDAFVEIRGAVEPLARGRDPELLTEVVWASCHGLASLAQDGRLRPGLAERRLDALVDAFVGADAAAAVS